MIKELNIKEVNFLDPTNITDSFLLGCIIGNIIYVVTKISDGVYSIQNTQNQTIIDSYGAFTSKKEAIAYCSELDDFEGAYCSESIQVFGAFVVRTYLPQLYHIRFDNRYESENYEDLTTPKYLIGYDINNLQKYIFRKIEDMWYSFPYNMMSTGEDSPTYSEETLEELIKMMVSVNAVQFLEVIDNNPEYLSQLQIWFRN